MVKNLRRLRISSGITQHRLAEAIGVTQQSINKYENHNVEPDIDTLIRFADFFNTSVDELVGHQSKKAADSSPDELSLGLQELQLVSDYRKLSPKEKASIRLVIKNYLAAKE